MSKGSTRRKCQVSREEEQLRWKLALGKITMQQFCDEMDGVKLMPTSTGICAQCKHGATVGPDYKIMCLVITGIHGPYHTCPSFEEEK